MAEIWGKIKTSKNQKNNFKNPTNKKSIFCDLRYNNFVWKLYTSLVTFLSQNFKLQDEKSRRSHCDSYKARL